jgi:hypothetical protein
MMPDFGTKTSRDLQQVLYCVGANTQTNFAVLRRRAWMDSNPHNIVTSPCQRRTQQDGSMHQVARC